MSIYEGSITLFNVNDGQDGQPGADGSAGVGISSTVIQYAISDSGSQHPDSGWVDEIPDVPVGKYLWTKITFNYSNSTTEISYLVSRVGEDGTDGIDGTNGKDGIGISSTLVQYAVSDSGTTPPSDWEPDIPSTQQGQYLWTKTIITYTDESTSTLYSVSRDGKNGQDGENGKDGAAGVGIESTVIQYAVSNSGTEAPEEGWNNTIPSVSQGQYLWTRTIFNYTNEETSVTYSISRSGEDGTNGQDGTDGKGIKSTVVEYVVSNSGTSTPSSGWQDTIPAVSQGKYLWTRTTFTYTDNSTSITYSVSRNAVDGQDGTNGEDGVGIIGSTIQYAASSSGTEEPESGWQNTIPSIEAGEYLWTKTTINYSDSTSSVTYSVSRNGLNGQDGEKGDKGDKGDAGIGIASTIIQYATSTSGTTPPSSWEDDIPTVPQGQYLWTRTIFNYTDGSGKTMYSVSREAQDGADGQDGQDGAQGAPGVGIESTVISYAASSSGTSIPSSGWQSTIPSVSQGRYLWTRTTFNYTNETSSVTYAVSRNAIDGTDGQNGADGADGKGIKSTTIEYAVSGSGTSAPSTGWSTSIPSTNPGQYLWTKTTFTYTDETTNVTYSVSRSGLNGSNGEDGVGISSSVIEYVVSSSGTQTPASGWSTTIPSLSKGQFLWTRTTINYTNGTKTYSYSVSRDGLDGQDGSDGSDGIGIKTTKIEYAISTSGTSVPSSGWSTSVPSTSPGQYLWTRMTFTYTNDSDYISYSVSRSGTNGTNGTNGKDGEKGEDGRGIKSTTVEYGTSSSGTTPPSKWQPSIPTITSGNYLWTKTVITYTDDTTSTSYSVSKDGLDGEAAPNVKAQYSVNGTSSWHNTFAPTTDKYIRFSYDDGKTWGPAIKIVGDKGDKGDKGDQGDNAIVYRIETNQSEILKFKTTNTNADDFSFSPEELEIYVYKQSEGVSTLLSLNEYKILLEVSTPLTDEERNWGSLEFLKTLETPLLVQDTTNKKWILKVQEIADTEISNTALQNLRTALNQSEIALKITAKDLNNNVISIWPLSISFGSTKNMATFALNANGINASIQNSSLQFNANGLTINNGSLVVNDENENKVFYFDDETGNLVISGEIHAYAGSFTGTVNATDGTFTGTINAESGSLKDLSIDGLLSINNNLFIDGRDETDVKGIYSSNYLQGVSGFYLSSNGNIYANSIILGASASIEDFIRLGNAYILNPTFSEEGDQHNHIFIRTNATQHNETYDNNGIIIYDDGRAKFGAIDINGINSSITALDNNDGFYWQLTDTDAIFNNIYASGKISTAVFETDTTRVSGGTMVFKDASIVKEYSNTSTNTSLVVPPEDLSNFSVDEYVLVSTSNYYDSVYAQVDSITTESSTIVLDRNIGEKEWKIIIKLGSVINNKGLDWIIGVNSSASENRGLGLSKNAITFSSFEIVGNNVKYNNELILGSLPSTVTGQSNISGLYASSAYLNGTLTTNYSSNEEILYAGVNTINGANFTMSRTEPKDTSPIVFWAGAEDTTATAIQNAPFQVSSNGYLYAQKGYFVGSIITDATITAAVLETARIIGTGTEEDGYALSIEDVSKGIVFKDNSGTTRMEMTNEGLKLNMPFQVGENFFIDENGKLTFNLIVLPPVNQNTYTILYDGRIGFSSLDVADTNNISYLGYLSYNQGIRIYDSGSLVSTFNSNSITLQKNTYMQENVSYGNKIEYRKVTNTQNEVIGYDLYVME